MIKLTKEQMKQFKESRKNVRKVMKREFNKHLRMFLICTLMISISLIGMRDTTSVGGAIFHCVVFAVHLYTLMFLNIKLLMRSYEGLRKEKILYKSYLLLNEREYEDE